MLEQQHWVFPQIDPVIFSLGPVSVRWYGLMYLVGFIAAFLLAKQRIHRIGWSKEQLSDFLFWGFLGVIVGGRVGYVLFYQFGLFLDDPLYLLKIWTGGMSFHGGLLGVLVAIALYARKMNMPFLALGDFVAPLVPIGLGAGRLGNFLNAELWGRTTDVPWGVIFPGAGPIARHPSQLYEFFLEGVVLFILLWWFSAKPRPRGAVGGLFLAGYGCFRFIIEYYREPDAHIGLYTLGLSQGQLLCIPMIGLGVWLIVRAYRKPVFDNLNTQHK
ncbi:prolipoprotein diacylglyceryl transferase [Alteromonas oceanisediminis]|uniref:prolipoprotein diacylglyceryl transferase n=1 Tax=Alteromonas oceanisediminis TaxID=2836180 RepID=UPI001BD9324C|nr:prolipoprotein diacylglyceryl transferase [Alteromonas oceanisediminis]MBT0585374.1 prolipoprotein diacylglyceryl transferase [Alteromonas oceanisediminis]